MKINDLTTPLLSGRMGNLIYYVRNGKQCVRRVAIPGKKRKWEMEERSEKQKALSGRFAIVQTFYSEYCERVSPVIWRLAAKENGQMPHNLFNSLNCKCFSGSGMLVDFEKFLFTQGQLLLPWSMRIEQNGRSYRVTWEEERDWETAAPTDKLCVGVLYSRYPGAPRLLSQVTGRRGELCGEFSPDEILGKDAHIYCFFAREDETAFSESCYFRVGGEQNK